MPISDDLNQAYRSLLAQNHIPLARHSYYLRWLNLYFDTCTRNQWSATNQDSLEPFLEQIRRQHPQAFLQQQARDAVWLFQTRLAQSGTDEEDGKSRPSQDLQQLAREQQAGAQPFCLDDNQILNDIVHRIKNRLKRKVADIFANGEDLLAAKSLLPHGQFGVWLKLEFNMTHQTANRYMNVAEGLKGKMNTVFNLSPKALYELASPSTSPKLRNAILKRLQAGETVSYAQIKALKQVSVSPPRQVPSLSRALPKLNRQLAQWLELTSQVTAQTKRQLNPKTQQELVLLQQQLKELQARLQGLNTPQASHRPFESPSRFI